MPGFNFEQPTAGTSPKRDLDYQSERHHQIRVNWIVRLDFYFFSDKPPAIMPRTSMRLGISPAVKTTAVR